MREKISYNKIAKIGYILCFIACFIFYIYVGKSINKDTVNNGKNNIIQEERTEKFTGWKVVEDSEWDSKKGNSYKTIMNKLPDEYIPDASICFRSYQEVFEVFVDGESIYEFGLNNNKFSQSPGGKWNIIRLPKDYMGKTIIIKVYDPYNEYKGNTSDISIGTKIAHIKAIINKYIVGFITSGIILILSIILILLYCFSKEIRNNNKNVIYLGLFLFIISLWSLTESTLLQILGMNALLALFQAFITAALIPLSFIMYIKSEFDYKYKNLTNALICIYIGIFISMLLLQITGIMDLKKTIVMSHIFMVISAMESTRIIFTNIKNNFSNKKIAIVSIILIVCAGIIDLIRYYFNNFVDVSFFTRLILMVNSVLIIINCIKSAMKTYFNRVKEDTYKELAYTDIMTGLKNRNCFQETMVRLNKNLNHNTKIGMIVFDVNDLKKINDKYGHLKGDELILNSSKVIKDIFNNCGEIYRIGGDEFCVIVEKTNEIKEKIEIFKEFLKLQENVDVYEKILISYGYEEFDYNMDKDLYELFEKADKKMYQYKMQTKK